MSEAEGSQFLALEIPEDELLFAIAEDARLHDRALDALEAEIRDPGCDAGWAASVALTIGRSGRARSVGVLAALRQRLIGAGQGPFAQAVGLAIELLPLRPGSAVERADSGYRYRDPRGSQPVFVEDPIAAHWHAQGRWGPPIRPDLARPAIAATPGSRVDALYASAKDGQVVIVTFGPDWLGRPSPALRITRAGVGRDPMLLGLARFSSMRSVGVVERRFSRFAAFEIPGEPLVILPGRPSLPVEALADLLGRLLNDARS